MPATANKAALAKKRAAFLTVAKTKAKAWKTARKTKPAERQGKPDIEDGSYPVKVTAEFDVPTSGKMKGQAIVRLTGTVSEGEYEGVKASQFYNSGRDESMGYLCGDLKRLMPDETDTIESSESMGDLLTVLDALNESPPECMADFAEDSTGKYVNIRFNDLLEGEESEGDDGEEGEEEEEEESEEEGDGEEEAEEEETEEEGEEEEEEEEEEEANEPTKGDEVSVKKGKVTHSGKIISVNKRQTTATIKTDKGKTLTGVAWSDLIY